MRFDRKIAAGLAVFGGAALIGTGLAALVGPGGGDAAGTVHAFTGPSATSLDTAPIAAPAVGFPPAVAAKVDRLPRPKPRPAAGPAPARVATAVRPSGITITTSMPNSGETVAMPVLAYASLEPDAGTPFDRLIVPARPALLPPRAIEAPAVAEEDDDVVELLPVPRPKPKLGTIDGVAMPLPQAKPALAAVPLPQRSPLEPGRPVAAAAPEAKPAPARNTILALLTAPTEPSSRSAPAAPAPGAPIVTRTPFGVPYVLQTESVDTACLRPELLEVLRRIESHYGKKVVVTSGYRDRGRPGSLHRRCAAADIVVPGVSAQALTSFARTVPGVGGVGQYCHQSLVHVDVGTPRDWKYGCGSYFAMRDGSAGWGRQPGEE